MIVGFESGIKIFDLEVWVGCTKAVCLSYVRALCKKETTKHSKRCTDGLTF